MLLLPLLLALLCLAPQPAHTFDQRELQLFDLVEEVNANFYELLGTTRSASGPDIRRAFRKVSLVYHPDRLNKHDDETVDFFRRLNAIHEVLKDEHLRQRYDEILDNGLPDWRMPVYYYRKWRKLSLVEALIVFAVTFTVGHYLVMWGVYFERKLAIEDLFRGKSRKRQKKLEKEFEEVPLVGPTWRDLLPLATGRGVWYCVVGAPDAWRAVRAYMADRRVAELERRREAEAAATELAEEAWRRELRKQQKLQRREQQLLAAQQQLLSDQQELLNKPAQGCLSIAFLDAASDEAPSSAALVEGPWSDAEQQLLVRAVARFPGGTPARWEKIAALLHRAVPDVTAKAREVEAQVLRQKAATFTAAFEINNTGDVCGDSDESDEDAEGSSDGGGGRAHRRGRKNRRRQQRRVVEPAAAATTAATAAAAASAEKADDGDASDDAAAGAGKHRPWSQPEQTQLEAALRQFPKGTRERWERVAELVTNRGPDECAQRCKALNERLRLKKE